MDKKALQIPLAEDKPADTAIIREALKHRDVECDFQILCDGGKALAVIDRLDAEFEATTLYLLIVDMHLPRHDGDAILNRLRAIREGRRVRVGAMSGQFGPHFVAHEGLVCFSKPSTVDEFLRLGAIISGVLLEGRRADASGPKTGS
jgi:CheY-like chemotaxis protein